LGADAANVHAVAKIFLLKSRPADHPLIVHVASAAELDRWAAEIPRLREPSPALLAGPAHARSAQGGCRSLDRDRRPGHGGAALPVAPDAQALLREFARVGSGAIAAPSANKFGHVSPTTAQHVRDEFGDDLFVLDGGACEVGLESTIVDLSRAEPMLLRPGAITRDDIEAALGRAAARPRCPRAPRFGHARRALRAAQRRSRCWNRPRSKPSSSSAANVAVLALREPLPTANVTSWITAPSDPRDTGMTSMRNLRTLDVAGRSAS
jgi:L-threonylcarbamoyladenylate synthase